MYISGSLSNHLDGFLAELEDTARILRPDNNQSRVLCGQVHGAPHARDEGLVMKACNF